MKTSGSEVSARANAREAGVKADRPTVANAITLQHNRPLRIVRATRIECIAGRVWLTSAGQAGDVFLRAGERFTVDGRGLALIEALGTARVVLQPPALPLLRWMRAIAIPKRWFLLSSPDGLLRAMRLPQRRTPLAG